MHGIIRRIATAVGVVMANLVALVVTAAGAAIRHSAQRVTVKFSSSRSSPIPVTSTRTLAVLSAAQASISISLRMAAECSSMSLARRGRSIHAPTIPLFDIISHPPKAGRVSLLVRRPNRASQIQKRANAKNQQRSRHPHRSQHHHASQRGRRLAGCRSWLRRLLLDR